MSAATIRPFTVNDLARLPEDGRRHEILNGVLLISPSPGNRHQAVLGELAFALWLHLETHPLGHAQLPFTEIVLSPIDVLVPDLLFICAERMKEIYFTEGVRGAPDLIVEIVTPMTIRRDRGQKLEIYDRFGVGEYWLPNPRRQAVEVYRRQCGRMACAEVLTEPTDTLATPLLPGFSLTLARLFRDPWERCKPARPDLAEGLGPPHPVDQVRGILTLDRKVDELLDETRGPGPEST